jgi:hypothetical protein
MSQPAWQRAAPRPAAPVEAAISRFRGVRLSARAVAVVMCASVALVAAAVGTPLLSRFAADDGAALILVALSVATSVRFVSADRLVPHAGFLIGAPLLALANATTLGSVALDPVAVGLLALLVGAKYGGRQGARCAVMYVAVVAGLLSAAVALSGTVDLQRTTVATRGLGSDAIIGGGFALVGLAAAAAALYRRRRESARIVAAQPRLPLDSRGRPATTAMPHPAMTTVRSGLTTTSRHVLTTTYRGRSRRTGATTSSAV